MKTNIAGSGAEKAGTDSFAADNADSKKTETAVSYDTNMETAEEIKYEYETHELYAENDGKQIYGVVYVPQNAGDRMPTIIYSHGFGDTHRSGMEIGRAHV